MKITSSNSNLNPVPGKISNSPVSPKTPAEQTKTAGNKVDTITIGQQSSSVSDDQFIDALKNQIIKEVRAGTDIHKLEDLKKQIASGEYNIDPADIARRLIGDPTGEA